MCEFYLRKTVFKKKLSGGPQAWGGGSHEPVRLIKQTWMLTTPRHGFPLWSREVSSAPPRPPEFAWSQFSPAIPLFPGESVTIPDPIRKFRGGLQTPFYLKDPWELAPFCLTPLTAYRFNPSGPGPGKERNENHGPTPSAGGPVGCSETLPAARLRGAGNDVCPRPAPKSTFLGELGTLGGGREGMMNVSAQGLLSVRQELSRVALKLEERRLLTSLR